MADTAPVRLARVVRTEARTAAGSADGTIRIDRPPADRGRAGVDAATLATVMAVLEEGAVAPGQSRVAGLSGAGM